jgi:hypothetical protein
LSIPVRGGGTALHWLFNTSDSNFNGKYLFSPRGSTTSQIDFYDISSDKWDFQKFYSPQSDILGIGSSYMYDGIDTIYMIVNPIVNDFIYIYALNVNTMQIDGGFQTTTLQGSTVHIGNMMTIVNSPDGGKFIFIAVNNSRLMYKTLIS